ncbi:MAG: rod-binding protein [Oligoflexales bacterium]
MNIRSQIEALSKNAVYERQDGLLQLSPQDEAKKVGELAKEFESIFMEIVLKSMREATTEGGLMGGGNGENIFRSMLDQEYAKQISQQDQSGLAKAIEDQLLSIAANAIDKSEGQKAYDKLKMK